MELDLSLDEFREIMVLSGTDYNIKQIQNIGMEEIVFHFNRYKKSGAKNFYEWMNQNTDYVLNTELLIDNCNMFCLDGLDVEATKNKTIFNIKKIKKIMEADGFMFT
jgi:hypothetical protein